MSEEDKTLARRLIEKVYNDGNLEVIDEIVAEDYVHHDPTMSEEEGHGREHLKEFRACLVSNRVRLGGAKSAAPSWRTAP